MATNQFEQGEVVWFHPEKRYGFLKTVHGEQVFFHFNDGRFPKVAEDGEFLYGEHTIQGFAKRFPLPEPKYGDILLFERTKGNKGRVKASPWCFSYLLEEAFREFERDNEICSCGHKWRDHAGAICMASPCHCGDEAYEHDEYEPREVNLSDSPGGLKIYE